MNAFLQLLLNPAIMSLVGGCILGMYTRLNLPGTIMDLVSMYLVFAIGYKGGACLGVGNECTPPLLMLTIIGMLIGLIQPFIYYGILKKTTPLTTQTLIVLAAQYGSISIVTFITAISFLGQQKIGYDMYMTALAGLMEIPALFSGLWLINKHDTSIAKKRFIHSLWNINTAIITCKKINVIFIGFFAGLISSYYPTPWLDSSIVYPFNIMLVLFMIDIGITVAKQREHITKFSPSLIAFGIYAPIISGIVSIPIAHALSISLGSMVLFAGLISSASYIAVPAIMQSEAPQAKHVIYMPMALGITLPFNILIGIPCYYYVGMWIQKIW